MQNFGVNLATNYSSGAASDSADIQWSGAKAVLVITATAFPATCVLRYRARGGATIDIQAVAGNGMYVFDLPKGLYYLHMAGVATALNADLVNVPQG